MAEFTILEQGQEPGKPQRFARCLYGDSAIEITVIIGDDVLTELSRRGVTSFPAVIGAALDAAQAVDRNPKQVVVLKDTPILKTIIATLCPHHQEGSPPH
jgi:hypothetical protein